MKLITPDFIEHELGPSVVSLHLHLQMNIISSKRFWVSHRAGPFKGVILWAAEPRKSAHAGLCVLQVSPVEIWHCLIKTKLKLQFFHQWGCWLASVTQAFIHTGVATSHSFANQSGTAKNCLKQGKRKLVHVHGHLESWAITESETCRIIYFFFNI